VDKYLTTEIFLILPKTTNWNIFTREEESKSRPQNLIFLTVNYYHWKGLATKVNPTFSTSLISYKQ